VTDEIYTIREIIERIESKIDTIQTRLESYDERVRALESDSATIKGSISLVKWATPIGITLAGLVVKFTDFIGK
jgi:peptidoglycan hydrolase CwlO-like protein